MDFTFTPEQDEAAELAARILKDRATNERMKQVEADGDRFDRELWAELGSAGLLGLALPEEYDGAGLGLIELCRVLVEVGRTVAPVPLVAHGAAGRLIAEQGTADQKQAWLPGAASGARLLTAAVAEDRESLPQHPPTTARHGRRRLDPERREDAGPDRDPRRPASWSRRRRRPGRASSSSSRAPTA